MRHRLWCVLLPTLMASGALAEGDVWAPLGPDGGRMSAVAFDPDRPDTLYVVAQRSAFRRVGSDAWQRLPVEGVSSLAVASDGRVYLGGSGWVARSRDHGGVFSLFELPGDGTVALLTVDPADNDRIYAVREVSPVEGPVREEILTSADGGSSWQSLSIFSDRIAGLAIDADDPQTLYVGAEHTGVLVSSDGGVTWEPAGETSPCPGVDQSGLPLRCVEALLARPGALFIGTYDRGVLRSQDGGETWQGVSDAAYIDALIAAPGASDVLFAAGATAPPMHLNGRGLLLRSDDGGSSWHATGGELVAPVGAVAVDPGDADRLYAATGTRDGFAGHGLYASGDGGASWSPDQTGLDGTCIGGIVATNTSMTTLYAVTLGDTAPAYVSRDGGGEWVEPETDPPRTSFWSLAADPNDASRLYAAAYADGLLASTDGGATWSRRGSGIDDLPALDVAVDAVEHDTLFITGPGGGVSKSTDGGATFAPVLTDSSAELQVEVDPASGALYALSYGALQVSHDGGATWERLFLATATSYFFRVAVAPTDPATLYVLGGDGLYVSDDGGRRWNAAPLPGPNPTYVQALAVDPSNPRTAYAMGLAAAPQLYRTDNRGLSWRAVGKPFFGALDLAVDPHDARLIYGATCGAGVQLLAQSASDTAEGSGCAVVPPAARPGTLLAHGMLIGLLALLGNARRSPRPRTAGSRSSGEPPVPRRLGGVLR